MKRLRFVLGTFGIVTCLSIATLALPLPADARVHVSVGIGLPVVVAPAPVFVAPPPAVVYPVPVGAALSDHREGGEREGRVLPCESVHGCLERAAHAVRRRLPLM